MHPRPRDHRTDAVRDDDHILHRDTVRFGNMPHKRIHIPNQHPDVFRRPALSRRSPMPPRIPGKNIHISKR